MKRRKKTENDEKRNKIELKFGYRDSRFFI